MELSASALSERLAKLSEQELREAGLQAIRLTGGRKPDAGRALFLPQHDWFPRLLEVLAGAPVAQAVAAELAFIDFRPATISHAQTRVAAFWHWMEHSALAHRFTHPQQGHAVWMITDAGWERAEGNQPFRLRAIERLRAEFLADHEDSLARFEDAFTCVDRGLFRPAVVMLGLAFEELIATLSVQLAIKPKRQASEVQEALRKHIEANADSEQKRAALCALNVADSIRDARNNAAHKAASEWHAMEVDELLADGVRAYPKLASYRAASRA